MLKHHTLPIVAALALSSPFVLAQEVNILDEGNFDSTFGNMPSGFHWSGFAGDSSVTPNRFELISEASGQFVRLTVPPNTDKQLAFVELKEAIPLPTDWTALNVSAKFRVKNYEQGMENWHGVKVFLTFYDDLGSTIGADVAAITLKEDTAQWTTLEKEVMIPPGSASFKIKAGIMGSSGVVEIDDLSVIPVK